LAYFALARKTRVVGGEKINNNNSKLVDQRQQPILLDDDDVPFSLFTNNLCEFRTRHKLRQ